MSEPTLREYLRANLFDGDEAGVVTMPISGLLDELINLLDEYDPAFDPILRDDRDAPCTNCLCSTFTGPHKLSDRHPRERSCRHEEE